MKVVLVTQGVSRIVPPLADFLGPDLIAVIESAPRSYKARKMLFRGLFKRDLARYARKRSIPYFLLSKINQPECIDWLNTLSPDIVVVYSMSQLLSSEFLAIPRFGCINLHPSLLPKYRGPNPWFWTYYYQDVQSGVTLHFLDPGEDTGPIVDQRRFEVPLGIKSPELQNLAISQLGVDMIINTLKKIKTGSVLESTPQPASSSTVRARNLKLSEHAHIIKWSEWSVERIWHLMRGTELWLNCIEQPSGWMKGLRWSIDGYEKTDFNHSDTRLLGTLSSDGNGRYVICRDGLIRIHVNLGVRTILKVVLKNLYCKFARL